MKSKRFVIFILIAVLIIAITGCSNEDKRIYDLTVKPKTPRTGTVMIDGENAKYEKDISAEDVEITVPDGFKKGEEITLTAEPEEGYKFDHWEGKGFNDNTDNPLTFNIVSDITLLAVFIDDLAPSWTEDPDITTAFDVSSVGVSVAIDDDGKIYYKIMEDGAATQTAEDIKDAENSTTVTAGEVEEITINDLESGINYDIYFAAEDSNGNLQNDDQVRKVDLNTKTANISPVIESISNVENEQAEVIEGKTLELEVMATDADGDSLNYSISGDDADKFSQSDNVFSWTPSYGDYSSDNKFNITIEVSDDTETVTEDIEITVQDDTTAPSVPAIEGISSGTYNTDQNFTISGGEGTTIEYSLDEGENWNEYEGEVTLSEEGTYNITARQTDEAGNTSDNTEVITVIIDKSDFASGSGTSGDPYQIETWYHLDNVREYAVEDGSNYVDETYFVLKNDLNQDTEGYTELASSSANGGDGWEPIGYGDNSEYTTTPFTENFDGSENQIDDLNINNSDLDYAGLFGVSTGKVINVEMHSVNISAKSAEAYTNAGGLVGYVDGGTINNCTAVTGNISSTDQNGSIGGLVGYNSGTVTDCIVNVTVDGDNSVGGLIGANSGDVSSSDVYGNVNCDVHTGTENAGGLVGDNSGDITNSVVSGEVTGKDTVGGLVGTNYDYDGSASISSSHATGVVTGDNEVGGLVGYNNDTLSNSYACGDVTGDTKVGGLVGNAWGGTVDYSYAKGYVEGDNETGGLIGYKQNANITSSYYDMETTGQSDTGKGEAKTTSEMMQQDTFVDWDFDTIWNINEGTSYPTLR
ncbi:MAG: OmpL47-type beta-barrel domain-containing protein [Halanaerobiales bacterium]